MTAAAMDIFDCNCLSIRRAARLLTGYYDSRLEPSGLRASQFGMLLALSQSDSMSVNRLAEVLELDRTTTGRNLQPLVRDGYVDLSPSPVDARVREARLTRTGKVMLRSAQALWEAAQSDLEKVNGSKAMARLRDDLAGLVLPATCRAA